MSKDVLIISTSPRKGGNSDTLADEFMRGAMEAGHKVEKVNLYDKNINFCKGCLACQTTMHCVIKDDVSTIVERMKDFDVVVFATPIYFFEMSGQMKTFLDRTNPLYTSDYKFRDIYLLASAAEEHEEAMDGAIKGLEGWIACYEHTKLAGVIRAVSSFEKKDVKENTSILKKTYEMGRKC